MHIRFLDLLELVTSNIEGAKKPALMTALWRDLWSGIFEHPEYKSFDCNCHSSPLLVEQTLPGSQNKAWTEASRPQLLELMHYRQLLPEGIFSSTPKPFADLATNDYNSAYHRLSMRSLDGLPPAATQYVCRISVPIDLAQHWLASHELHLPSHVFGNNSQYREHDTSYSFTDARTQTHNVVSINIFEQATSSEKQRSEQTQARTSSDEHSQGHWPSTDNIPPLIEAPIKPTPKCAPGRPTKKKEIEKELVRRIQHGEVCLPKRTDEADCLHQWAQRQWGEKAPAYKTIYNMIGEIYGPYRDKGIIPE